MCTPQPPCPSSDAADRETVHLVAHYPEQGWCVDCAFLNSLSEAILAHSSSELAPASQVIAPHWAVVAMRAEAMR